MQRFLALFIVTAALSAAPLGALAVDFLNPLTSSNTSVGEQLPEGHRTLTDMINIATEVTLLAVPWAMIVLIFVWNLMRLIATLGDAEKKKEARSRIMWGIIIMFVMFTVAGIVALVQNTLFGPSSALFAPPGGL